MTHISPPNSYSGYLDVKKKELSVVGKVNSEEKTTENTQEFFHVLPNISQSWTDD